MSEIHIKVYLLDDGESCRPEIRRFKLDFYDHLNFEYLREQLQWMFPILKERQYNIYWKDSDGDMITITEDTELKLAMDKTLLEPIRKFYVKIRYNHQPHPSPSSNTLHNGIVCDGCNGPIYGFRFKCIKCPNFDLCSCCQSQGIHPEHCMLRLVNPLDTRAHFGKRFMRHMNKFTKKNSQPCDHYDNNNDDNDDDEDDDEEAKNKGKGYKCGNKKWEKHNKSTSHCPVTSNFESIMNIVSDHMNALTSIYTGALSRIPEINNSMQQQTQDQNKKQTKENSESEKQNNRESCSESNEIPKLEIPRSSLHNDFIKIVERNLSSFLTPLGMNVNVQMKTSNHEEPMSSNNDEKSNLTNNVNDKTENSIPSTSKSNSETITSKTVDKTNTTDKDNSVSSSTEKGMNDQPTTSKKNDEYVLNKEAHSDPEWTVIDQVTPKIEDEPKKLSASLYPELQTEKKIYHHDPKIQKAVELMIQMGFSNDNDQLTNCLVAKNGDIVSVIDML